MRFSPGRVGPLVAAATMLVGTAACNVESPASTRTASTPAILFHHPTVDAAWNEARARHRPLVVMFTSDNCPYCVRMLNETYADPSIRQLLSERAETVLAHAAQNRELAQRLGVHGFPTSVVVSADGQIADVIVGYVDVPTLASRLAPWLGAGGASSGQVALSSGVR